MTAVATGATPAVLAGFVVLLTGAVAFVYTRRGSGWWDYSLGALGLAAWAVVLALTSDFWAALGLLGIATGGFLGVPAQRRWREERRPRGN